MSKVSAYFFTSLFFAGLASAAMIYQGQCECNSEHAMSQSWWGSVRNSMAAAQRDVDDHNARLHKGKKCAGVFGRNS